METIGFVGLGIMGAPMAGHLLDAGYAVIASDHRGAPPKPLARQGPEDRLRPRRRGAGGDIVITMVPDTPQVADVLFGERGVAAGLSAGKLVIDMSSISPIETKKFAEKINALGCDYLDAPVSGGEVGAKAASLTIMVGGARGGVRAREAGVREDGQEHHAGRAATASGRPPRSPTRSSSR